MILLTTDVGAKNLSGSSSSFLSFHSVSFGQENSPHGPAAPAAINQCQAVFQSHLYA